MIVFLVQGIGYDDLIKLADSALYEHDDERPFLVGSEDALDIECFDSEMGKTYKGAAAFGMLLDYRMKYRND